MNGPATVPPVVRYRVLIVEDQNAIREMLAMLIATLPDFEVVGAASGLDEAVTQAEDLRPDVILLDWIFPGGNGDSFLQRLSVGARRANILVFSALASAHAVRRALSGGARGFVEKGASVAMLTEGLRTVAAGGTYLSPIAAQTLGNLVAEQALSRRESEVLCLLAQGLPSKAMAVQQGVSLKTINNQRAAIVRKTGLHSIAQLTMYAAQLGLIPGPGDTAGSIGAAAHAVA
jgi:DNA-binding NarL/FixJ family response regulator